MLRHFSSVEGGRALLTLQNTSPFGISVEIGMASLEDQRNGGVCIPALLRLQPDQSVVLDISDNLAALLGTAQPETRETRITIDFRTTPDLNRGLGPGVHVVEYQSGQFTRFSAARVRTATS